MQGQLITIILNFIIIIIKIEKFKNFLIRKCILIVYQGFINYILGLFKS